MQRIPPPAQSTDVRGYFPASPPECWGRSQARRPRSKATFNQWEYLYYQHRDGSIPTEYWVGAEDYYRNMVGGQPGYARFWSGNQSSFDEPFRSYAAEAFATEAAPTGDNRKRAVRARAST